MGSFLSLYLYNIDNNIEDGFPLLNLPCEIIEYILCFLSVDELGFMKTVCKQLLYFINNNDNIWEICFYNSFEYGINKKDNILSWKDFSILTLLELTSYMKQHSKFIEYYYPISNIPINKSEKLIFMYPIQSFKESLVNTNNYKRAFVWCAINGYTILLENMLKSSSDISKLLLVGKRYPLGSDTYEGRLFKGNYIIYQQHMDVDYVISDRSIDINNHPKFPESSKKLIEYYKRVLKLITL